MKRNIDLWKQNILASNKRLALPIMTHSGIELIGKKVIDAVTNGEVHAQAVCALAEKYPSVASSVIMDLTVEAEAFGAEIHFSDNEVPSVVGRLVSTREEVEALMVPTVDKGRIAEYIKANKLVAERIDKPVVAGCIGPYSLAGRLFDMSEIMMAMFIEPDTVKMLLDKCTDFIISYCRELKKAGANAVLVAEPAAGLLSNDACQEFSSEYVKQIVEALQDESFLVFLHNCGNTGQCTKAMISTGAAGYHFGNAIDMISALEECPSDTLVMGNLDPVSLFKMSSAEKVYNETIALLQKTKNYKNFILSSGCDTPPEIPFENIEQFYKALNDFNVES